MTVSIQCFKYRRRLFSCCEAPSLVFILHALTIVYKNTWFVAAQHTWADPVCWDMSGQGLVWRSQSVAFHSFKRYYKYDTVGWSHGNLRGSNFSHKRLFVGMIIACASSGSLQQHHPHDSGSNVCSVWRNPVSSHKLFWWSSCLAKCILCQACQEHTAHPPGPV